MVRSVFEALENVGLETSGSPEYAVSHGGHRFFGVVSLKAKKSDAFGTVLGIRSSTDKSFSQAVAFGARVFVCDNLAFTGQVVYHTKNTTNILRRLPKMSVDAVAKLPEFVERQSKFLDGLKTEKVSEELSDSVIVRASVVGAVPSRDILAVRDIYRSDTHRETHGDGTAWSLFNAFTEYAKKYQDQNPAEAANRTIRLSNLFANEFAGDLTLGK
jgi:hypothetical protein